MTQQMLVGYLREFDIIYLDDIIVYSDNYEGHLAQVFEWLQTIYTPSATDRRLCPAENLHGTMLLPLPV